MTDTATEPDPMNELDTFRQRRELSVVQPLGSLALTTTQWVDSEQTIWGVPGTWAPLPVGQSGPEEHLHAGGFRLDCRRDRPTVIHFRVLPSGPVPEYPDAGQVEDRCLQGV